MKRYFPALLIFALVITACNIGVTAPQDGNALATAAALTVEAALSPAASPTAAEPLTVETPLPTATLTSEPACERTASIKTWKRDGVDYNKAEVEKRLEPGKNFVMSWEVENTGTCVWDDGYRMIFETGERLSQTDTFPVMPKGYQVQQGEILTISIQLTAPAKAGEYETTFSLVDADGENALTVGVLTNVGNTASNGSLAAPGELRYAYDCTSGIVRITLTWLDKADGEVGYRIYRDGVKLTDLPAGTTTYDDIAPSSGSYLYAVAAYDASGESSAKVQAATTACE